MLVAGTPITEVKEIRVAIAGSRDYPFLEMVDAFVDGMVSECQKEGGRLTIITGLARGVDLRARSRALKLGINVIDVPPDPRYAPRIAPIIRNTEIVSLCQKLVAFWDWQSHGTLDAIEKAHRAGKLAAVFDQDGHERPLAEVLARAAEIRRQQRAAVALVRTRAQAKKGIPHAHHE
jgi:hypothetical protein